MAKKARVVRKPIQTQKDDSKFREQTFRDLCKEEKDAVKLIHMMLAFKQDMRFKSFEDVLAYLQSMYNGNRDGLDAMHIFNMALDDDGFEDDDDDDDEDDDFLE